MGGLRRLGRQAERSRLFTKVNLLTENDLSEAFSKKFERVLKPSIRGFGYWLWKPEIISKQLEAMNDGDLLLYLDAGCRLNLRALDKMDEYFCLVDEAQSGLLLTQLDLPEFQWSKGDIFDFFSVRNDLSISQTGQLQAGILFLRKGTDADEVVSRWLSAGWDHPKLFDDSPSESPNFAGFVENRHDQSVLSVLAKLANARTISYRETQPGWHEKSWAELASFPIHARRERLGFYEKAMRRLRSNSCSLR